MVRHMLSLILALLHAMPAKTIDTSYYVSMDTMIDNVITGMGLNLTTTGNPELVEGVKGKALSLGGPPQSASFGNLRHLCAGNLELCSSGVTLAFWMKIGVCSGNSHYFLSNGGQTGASHGLTLLLRSQQLLAIYKTRTQQWSPPLAPITKQEWHHVTMTWHQEHGGALYVDGRLSSEDRTPVSTSSPDSYQTFELGKPNSVANYYGDFAIDEFYIIERMFNAIEVWNYYSRPDSPIHISMDSIVDGMVGGDESEMHASIFGEAALLDGIRDSALSLPGYPAAASLGNLRYRCAGNLELCPTGFTLAMWIKIGTCSGDAHYFISSGGQTQSSHGIALMLQHQRLKTILKTTTQSWDIPSEPITKNAWHHVAITWHPSAGAELYIDGLLRQHAGPMSTTSADLHGSFEIGRPNNMFNEPNFYADFLIDDLYIHETLLNPYEVREIFVGNEGGSLGSGKLMLFSMSGSSDATSAASLDITAMDTKGRELYVLEVTPGVSTVKLGDEEYFISDCQMSAVPGRLLFGYDEDVIVWGDELGQLMCSYAIPESRSREIFVEGAMFVDATSTYDERSLVEWPVVFIDAMCDDLPSSLSNVATVRAGVFPSVQLDGDASTCELLPPRNISSVQFGFTISETEGLKIVRVLGTDSCSWNDVVVSAAHTGGTESECVARRNPSSDAGCQFHCPCPESCTMVYVTFLGHPKSICEIEI